MFLRPSIAYVDGGEVFLHSHQTDPATADFDRALQLSSKDVSVRRFRAYAYIEKKDWEKALQDYDAILKRSPNDKRALERRGFVNQSLQKWPQAIADFARLIEVTPNDAEADRQRAYAYGMWKQYDERKAADLRQVVKLAPTDAEAKKTLQALEKRTPAPAAASPEPSAAGIGQRDC